MMEQKDALVRIKSRGDGKAVVAGYGVVWDGEDLYGETFTKDTDFLLDLVPEKPVLFNHGLPIRVQDAEKGVTEFSIKQFLGAVNNASIKADEFGLFVEAVLDESKEYVKEVLNLIEEGVIGWSSGSIGHLVERAGKTIKKWPIVEFSLTHTPAEPRTLGVEHIRALEAAGLSGSDSLEELDADEGGSSENWKLIRQTWRITND